MEQILEQIVQRLYDTTTSVALTRPDPQFGDWATNVALQLAKPLGKNPRQIAEDIAEALRQTGEFSEVSVAGPGFINLRLTDQAVLGLIRREPAATRRGQTVVIETNNPNPFKPMHIGHAYNATLADTLANLYAVSGAVVERVSYHGDVGAHVGKIMWALLRFCDGDVGKLAAIPEAERNIFMGKMYAEGSRAAKEDEAARTEIEELARQSFTREDPLYAAIYDTCFDWSFDEITNTVTRLGNQPTKRRYLESEADPVGVATVRANTPGVFKESDGALVFEGSKYGAFDNAFVGSNGRGLYAARDMGLIQLKAEDFPAMDTCVVVTGGEQAAYFKGVIAAAELALPHLKDKLVNVPTGLVKLTTGKMSSRTGDVVTIDWLFTEFSKAIEARGGEPTDEIIAGALRYQFLKVKVGGDVVFDVNEAVSLTGNTGSYLQYAHARARGILAKAESVVLPTTIKPEDAMLARKLSEYAEVVSQAAELLEPHRICAYLFELAQEFNRYYEKNKVIGSDDEAHRVGMVALYADTLKAGLAVLGIVAPEKL
ncbi:MAG: arginine--tRNA ligase [Candidatus Saccharibacteria bacterium]|nr:arginine--tRNA ligase [Candidatus Saccharibacteria bacterium]